MLSGELGYADGYGDKPLPFFKNFYAGGADSVRGFETVRARPAGRERQRARRQPQARRQRRVPVPDAGRAAGQVVRLAAFVDAGKVYGQGQKIELGELRYSAGLGVLWVSPLGPLRLSLAQPLNEQGRGPDTDGSNSPSAPASEASELRLHCKTSSLAAALAAGGAAAAARRAAAAAARSASCNTERILREAAPAKRAQKKLETRVRRSATQELAKIAEQLKRDCRTSSRRDA